MLANSKPKPWRVVRVQTIVQEPCGLLLYALENVMKNLPRIIEIGKAARLTGGNGMHKKEENGSGTWEECNRVDRPPLVRK